MKQVLKSREDGTKSPRYLPAHTWHILTKTPKLKKKKKKKKKKKPKTKRIFLIPAREMAHNT